MKWLDSHCHPQHLKEADCSHDQLLSSLLAEVEHILMVSVSASDAPFLSALGALDSRAHWSIGIHPCDVQEAGRLEDLEKSLFNLYGNCHAIGESGLDRFHDNSEVSLKQQIEFFEYHCYQAARLKKPLIVHTRDAGVETLAVLKRHADVQGVIHCFSESMDFARKVLDLGWYISFSGILTFPKAQELREVAQFAPLDRILIETDAPYLAPVPFRGKKNHPAFVRYVGETLAQLRSISEESLKERLYKNYQDFLACNATSS